jgi:ferrochelatase
MAPAPWGAPWKGVGLALSAVVGLRLFSMARRSLAAPAVPFAPPVRRVTGVLLVNTGTPDSTAVGDVRRYLRQFLSDGRVIDLPALPRWLLVNLIIAPFRAFSSARLYRRIFTDRGSPLKSHGLDVAEMLQKELGDSYRVRLAMRYQNPSMESVLAEMYDAGVDHLILVPLFPQYASASSGSVIDRFMKVVSQWWRLPHVTIVAKYWEDESFLKAWEGLGRQHLQAVKGHHVVFSYHGIPEGHIRKGSCGGHCRLDDTCCETYGPQNAFCYRAQCLHTSRALASRLGLSSDQYETVFQSRLGRAAWLQPYMQDKLTEWAHGDKKKVVVFCPSFVADCLETISELGLEAKEDFMHLGGEQWAVVPCLNTEPLWIHCLKDMVLRLDGARRPPGAL